MAVHHYTFTLTTQGPVHIGNGETYGKTDYFVTKDGRHVAVLDVRAFTQRLTPQQMDAYLQFLEEAAGKQSDDLTSFLRKHHLEKVAQSSCLYQAEMKLRQNRRGEYQYCDVKQCIKDGWGKPYVPGSSLKGMLRTALLGEIISKDPKAYRQSWSKEDVRSGDKRVASRAAGRLEAQALGNPLTDKPVDHAMHYISVSDSRPLELSDLVFAQKYDTFAENDPAEHKQGDKKGNRLNIYRESIRPGVDITFDVSVDDAIESLLPGIKLDQAGLTAMLKGEVDHYDKVFASKFGVSSTSKKDAKQEQSDGLCHYIYPTGLRAGMRCTNRAINGTGYCKTHMDKAVSAAKPAEAVTCYLGGGVGFTNKTVGDALLTDEHDYVNEVSRILYAQFPTKLARGRFPELERDVRDAGFKPDYKDYRGKQHKEDHRHWQDGQLGVSPHTFKYGYVDGKPYPMGKCELRIEEK